MDDVVNLSDARNFAQKWLPPIEDKDKITMINVLTGTEKSFGAPLLRKYVEMIQPYTTIIGIHGDQTREADCAASGIVFFYGCLCYIMHFPGWGKHIHDIFLYNLLYILVDHYIDDIRIHPQEKQRAIKQMYILIQDPLQYKNMDLIDPILKTIAIVYNQLIINCPRTKKSIIKLFQVEIEGLAIQKTDSMSRQQYYDIALKKGGYTMVVLQDIVGNTDPTITEASFHIGTIMQLIDDCVDVRDDQNNKIHTIATHDFQNGTLDNLWIDIVNRISKIDDRFTFFILLYIFFAVYLPDRNRECYSSTLRNQITPLNLFDYTHGCDGSALLVHAVATELITMDVLDQMKKLEQSSASLS